jgi:hypothetical protein
MINDAGKRAIVKMERLLKIDNLCMIVANISTEADILDSIPSGSAQRFFFRNALPAMD